MSFSKLHRGVKGSLRVTSIIANIFYINVLFLLWAPQSIAQKGVNICSCTPLVYKWVLDFDGVCPPPNVRIGTGSSITGIKEVSCNTFAQSGVTDLVPINITRYEILELNRGLETQKGVIRSDLSLKEGDVISFNSESVAFPSFVSGGLQAELRATNAKGEEIILFFLVRFTNKCAEEPFENGDSIGWMKFVRVFFLLRVCVLNYN